MRVEDIRSVSVLGAGIMGHGIAQAFLMGGYAVRLYDIKDSILETARAHIRKNMEMFAQEGLLDPAEIAPAMDRLITTTELGRAVEGSDFIVEAAPEDLSLKQDLFAQVEELCPPSAIVATNTSSLTLEEIGRKVKDRTRLVVTHWFNPPHIVPTVEVVRGPETSDETMETAVSLMQRIRKMPVRIQKELPGFLVNRIQTALIREVWDLYAKGVASAEDIDKAVKGTIGFRLASIGPLLTADLGGLDLWLRVYDNLVSQISSSTEAPKVVRDLVAQGHYGIKSGRGFYDYAVDFSKSELDEAVRRRDKEFLRRLRDQYWSA
ncbi:MAG: 3-hydroxyacyl-CoA dehydrogenase family protein [Thermodesulfobacteriota bacterium]